MRIENSIKILSQISDLYIYSRVSLDKIGGEAGLSYYRKYCRKFYFAPSLLSESWFLKLIKYSLKYLNKFIPNAGMFKEVKQPERDYQCLLKIADDIKADLIWLGYGNISYPLLKYIKEHSSYKTVLDTDSVWSRFVLRGLPFAKNDEEREKIEGEGRAKEEEEKWGTSLADVTTAVSEVDKEYYCNLIENKKKVWLFPNVIDFTNYQSKPINPEMKRPAVYLAGTFWRGSPMEEAARWIIKEVLPDVWTEYPSLHFYIIGKGSREILNDIHDKRISILGEVLSVLPYLCNVDIAMVPLKFESGTRFKILEAGACGIPIVSTTLGAEGLPVKHRENIFIADTPSEFSNSIKKLLENKEEARTIAEKCKRLIENQYSLSTGRIEAEKILNFLI